MISSLPVPPGRCRRRSTRAVSRCIDGDGAAPTRRWCTGGSMRPGCGRCSRTTRSLKASRSTWSIVACRHAATRRPAPSAASLYHRRCSQFYPQQWGTAERSSPCTLGRAPCGDAGRIAAACAVTGVALVGSHSLARCAVASSLCSQFGSHPTRSRTLRAACGGSILDRARPRLPYSWQRAKRRWLHTVGQ